MSCQQFDAESLGLSGHLVGEVCAADSFGEAGVVFDKFGYACLTANGASLYNGGRDLGGVIALVR